MPKGVWLQADRVFDEQHRASVDLLEPGFHFPRRPQRILPVPSHVSVIVENQPVDPSGKTRREIQNHPLAPRVRQMEVPRQMHDHGGLFRRPELHESIQLLGRSGVQLRSHAGLLKSATGQLHQAIIAFNPFLKKAERQGARLKRSVHHCALPGRPCCGRACKR